MRYNTRDNARYDNGSIAAFREIDINTFFNNVISELHQEVNSEERNKLLNVNETQYISYLVEKYQINKITLHPDQVTISDREEMIPAERFPYNFAVTRGKSYPKQVITYHIPFQGDKKLFRCRPYNSTNPNSPLLKLEDNFVSFNIINFENNSEEIKKIKAAVINCLTENTNNLGIAIVAFNNKLENEARRVYYDRKNYFRQQVSFVESLDVPFHKKEQVEETFKIPFVKKKVVVKPEASSTKFTPEPTLDNVIYQNILEDLTNLGISLERSQSTYKHKDEEALRDLFIMNLNLRYFHSVTGETFNKTGKTDILVRHEGKNAFVAECKFWHGIEKFYETIDQLLRYLTWRDSKTALINFVQNKEISSVIETVEKGISKHKCFVKSKPKKSDSWLEYEFHLEGDSRSVQVAVLSFHLP